MNKVYLGSQLSKTAEGPLSVPYENTSLYPACRNCYFPINPRFDFLKIWMVWFTSNPSLPDLFGMQGSCAAAKNVRNDWNSLTTLQNTWEFNGWSYTSGMVTDFREGTTMISLESQIWLRLADSSDDAFKIPSLDDGFVPPTNHKRIYF